MTTHKDLRVWQLSIELVEDVYRITSAYPKDELYGIVSQMRRCAVSVPSNIAEGAARQTKKEYVQFLYVSLGSLSELETQVEISHRLGLLADKDLAVSIENIRRMLLNLVKYLRSAKKLSNPLTLQPFFYYAQTNRHP